MLSHVFEPSTRTECMSYLIQSYHNYDMPWKSYISTSSTPRRSDILNTEQASGIAGHSRGEGPSALSRYSLLLGSYSQVCRYTVFLGHGMSKGRWNDQWNICDDIVRKTERLLVCKRWWCRNHLFPWNNWVTDHLAILENTKPWMLGSNTPSKAMHRIIWYVSRWKHDNTLYL